VAISDRIYKQYRVPDPWDPNAKKDSTPIGLGPVSLRLGEKRRQPAPHLRPKAPKQKKKPGQRDPLAGLPNVPKARRPASSSKAEVSTSKRVSAAPGLEEKDALAAEVAERMRAAEAARGGPWRRKRDDERETVSPSAPTPNLPIRPDAEEAIRARISNDEGAEEVESEPQRTSRSSRGSTGRFRMQAKKVTNAPVVRRRVEEQGIPAEEITEEVAAPPRRPMPTLSGTMDDFFGAAAQMGRLAMPKREDADAETSAEEE